MMMKASFEYNLLKAGRIMSTNTVVHAPETKTNSSWCKVWCDITTAEAARPL